MHLLQRIRLLLGDLRRRPLERRILNETTRFYLSSGRFNGLPVKALRKRDRSEAIPGAVVALLEKGLLTLNFGDRHPNPHILAFPPEPIGEQLDKIADLLDDACLYPTRVHLGRIVNHSDYQGRPFTLRLALGEPQLTPVCFDLSVFEFYRNDPRYVCRHNDISGFISVADKYFGNPGMKERDQILLETLGFAYDSSMNRAVASLLWYLSELSPEHQQVWNAKALGSEFKIHPDYYRTAIVGEWQERISVFEAVLHEMRAVNDMARAMGRAPLFRSVPDADSRPAEFSFLIRPTLKEFNDFILACDKLLSENIDLGFFRDEVPREDRRERPDGSVEVIRRGSLSVLSEWLTTSVRMSDRTPIDLSMATLKEIRKLRQRPAHAADENEFDQEYFREQRRIIMDVYAAVRTLRLVFANHPRARSVTVDEFLVEPRIWTY